MKLLRLKINEDFRSLKAGFDVRFLRDFDHDKMWDFMPYCLVGRNGSGKSNILEALAAIFYHLECVYLDYRPEDFDAEDEYSRENRHRGFHAEYSTPNCFELEYLFPIPISLVDKKIVELQDKKIRDFNAHIYIEKKRDERPVVKWLNRKEFADASEAHEELNRVEAKQFLPQYVIGYSSGENEILSLPFFKMRFIHYDHYEDNLRNEVGYSEPEGRLAYMDTQHSQAVFLTNYLMQDPTILEPIHKTIGVKAIRQFRIIIKESPPIPKYRLDEGATIEDQSLSSEYNSFFELTENLKRKDANSKDLKIIDKLINCATAKFYSVEDKTLYLDYYVDEDKKNSDGTIIELGEMKKAFQGNFDSALDLFRAFQILLTLNLYGVDRKLKKEVYSSGSLYVNETVPVLPSDKRIMRFKHFEIEKEKVGKSLLSKSLSDGEHQFLHAMGVCLLFKNTNSLFLLDEPETHFNPDWRAKFISILKDCLKTDGSDNTFLRELLITSHSPFIISDSHEENVLIFRKNDDTGVVTVERPDFNTFGASVNKITMKVFEKYETIGNYAKEALNEFYKRLEKGEDKERLIDEINEKLGDSVERVVFINKAIEK